VRGLLACHHTSYTICQEQSGFLLKTRAQGVHQLPSGDAQPLALLPNATHPLPLPGSELARGGGHRLSEVYAGHPRPGPHSLHAGAACERCAQEVCDAHVHIVISWTFDVSIYTTENGTRHQNPRGLGYFSFFSVESWLLSPSLTQRTAQRQVRGPAVHLPGTWESRDKPQGEGMAGEGKEGDALTASGDRIFELIFASVLGNILADLLPEMKNVRENRRRSKLHRAEPSSPAFHSPCVTPHGESPGWGSCLNDPRASGLKTL
jgi:hypothetical protein